MPNLQYLLPIYLAAANLVALALMGIDKSKSKKPGVRRIPEKTLFLAALLGGSLGAVAGMYTFRHKTKHLKFTLGIPVILVLQIVAAIFLYSRFFQ